MLMIGGEGGKVHYVTYMQVYLLGDIIRNLINIDMIANETFIYIYIYIYSCFVDIELIL